MSKEARAAYMREYRKRNPEKIRAIEKATKLRNREKVLARKKRYREQAKEKIYAYNKAYEKANRGMTAAICARKRYKRVKATPPFADFEKIKAVYREANRLSKETGVTHHVDHIVPINGKTVCGLHVSWNLQVLPAIANIRKSNNWSHG